MRSSRGAIDAAEDGAPCDPDALEGVAAPREIDRVIGQDAAEAAFAAAWTGGRRHHAWLLRGPRGVGKASFAYLVARRALTEGAGMGVGGDGEAARRLIAAGAHPGLFELRRGVNEKTKRARATIAVDDVRRMIGFFQLSAPEGGWRVALVDPADDLNAAAANALLKLLEEPPPRALFLLVAHAPGRLPATLLSRCRRLDFAPLSPEGAAEAIRTAAPELAAEARSGEIEALALIADGAPGEALRLQAAGGLGLYRDLLRLLERPGDAARQQPLAEAAASRDDAAGVALVARLLPTALARIARAPLQSEAVRAEIAARLPEEAATAARLCPGIGAARIWAEAACVARERLEKAAGLNLDPGRSILDIAHYLAEASRRAQAA